MEIAILIALCVCIILLVLLFLKQKRNQEEFNILNENSRRTENSLTGVSASLATRLDEMSKRSLDLNTLVDTRLELFRNDNEKLVKTVETKLDDIRRDNDERLEKMRETVDQKLQKTLESRISTSFDQVRKQLESVYSQLGEMQALAKDVGNLEKVLTNVKTRGIWGELQAERILQDILLPSQYDKNVITKIGSRDPVEFAVKLPGASKETGKEVGRENTVYLPIDSKFPREDYERLCDATQAGDTESIKALRKALEKRILEEAKDIRDKYIDVPHTTDFAVLFLPIEGLYAEVLSNAGLQERLQREFHVMLAGPTTLASLLNSLQMGFRTLAIEKKSAEVWHVLGEVKTQYNKFGDALLVIKKKLESASHDVDNACTRHRVMGKKLKSVEAVDCPELENEIPNEISSEIPNEIDENSTEDD